MFEDYDIQPLTLPEFPFPPVCGRCGDPARLLHRVTIQRDTEIHDRQTEYWDLCVGCLVVIEHVLHKED